MCCARQHPGQAQAACPGALQRGPSGRLMADELGTGGGQGLATPTRERVESRMYWLCLR